MTRERTKERKKKRKIEKAPSYMLMLPNKSRRNNDFKNHHSHQEWNWHHVSLDIMPQEGYSIAYAVFLPKKCITESNHKEASDRPKLRDILQNIWLFLFKNVKVMIIRERLRKHSRMKVTKKIWKWNELDPKVRKRNAIKVTTGGMGDNWMKCAG